MDKLKIMQYLLGQGALLEAKVFSTASRPSRCCIIAIITYYRNHISIFIMFFRTCSIIFLAQSFHLCRHRLLYHHHHHHYYPQPHHASHFTTSIIPQTKQNMLRDIFHSKSCIITPGYEREHPSDQSCGKRQTRSRKEPSRPWGDA